MRYSIIGLISLTILLAGAKAVSGDDNFIQIEGYALGYSPSLADGVHVAGGQDRPVQFSPGHRCLQRVQVHKQPLVPGMSSFGAEDQNSVRAKLQGLYKNIVGEKESWFKTLKGPTAHFYRDNLAEELPSNISQLLFVPMVLSPRPVTVTKVEWTKEAREIMSRDGWEGVQRYCGTHFVETVGEESFVIYSIRVRFPSAEDRYRFERVRTDRPHSPALALSHLQRMRDRFEFYGTGREVVLDVLQVGGRTRDIEALRHRLDELRLPVESEATTVTRAQVNCGTEAIEQCQKTVQAFLDFQFRRYNSSGERPVFTPTRYRIAPLAYVNKLTD